MRGIPKLHFFANFSPLCYTSTLNVRMCNVLCTTDVKRGDEAWKDEHYLQSFHFNEPIIISVWPEKNSWNQKSKQKIPKKPSKIKVNIGTQFISKIFETNL